MERRCPKCKGALCRLGNREKPFLCVSCHAWYREDETAVNAANYDRIISKSLKELAEYLAPCACPPIRFNKNTGDIVCPVNKEPSASGCKTCWLDWLKQEAKK